MTVRSTLLALSLLVCGVPFAAAQNESPLKKKDRVSIIGNTLADRMQHDGWLETYLVSRFPDYDLTFRNLGFAADEINPDLRLRSAKFGSPDEWLAKTKTDVVFAFFGYNESFAGQAGLQAFKEQLDGQIKAMLDKKYNGKSAPRIVIFSPVAFENLKSPNLPTGDDVNKNLALYTAAMAQVAKANKVGFVDLFTPTFKAIPESPQSWTINGVHLTEHGNREVAKLVDQALAGHRPEPQRTSEQMEKIRAAVKDKNFYWFNRYRTTDGYSIYGGRSTLKFVQGQTNFDVMQREMQILDQMTANRDPAVWAAAQGKAYKVDDSKLPEHLPVATNKKGAGPEGKHLFLSGEDAIAKMKVGKGLKVNLFASEEQWPELAAPVQMTWDTKGRLWVAVWPSYPHWKPGDPMNDKILIFEDTKGTGKADKMTVFADKLHNPTGFELWNGGCIVAHAPDVLFLKDTNGDGKADLRVRLISGIDSADTHHTANSFVLDPGGALYFQEGTFHRTSVETPYGPPARCVDAGVFRYEPRTQKFETYVAYGFANPHGHVFDRWGQDIVVDGTGAVPTHGTLFSGQVDFPNRHGGPPHVYKQKTRPCSGTEILSSKHFPESFDGNFLVANVIGFQGILRYKLEDDGASIKGIEQEPIVSSSDPNFRPSDIRTGPDGAIYFIDWHNPIIGHMQHNLRDPSRDHTHGRIYRVTAEGPLSKAPAIDGAPLADLLKNLEHPEDRVRYRTRIELSGRPTAEVVAAAKTWVAGLDAKDANYEHHLLEALWLHQAHNVVHHELLARMLKSPDFRARAAATKVLCYQRDRVPNALDLLRTQINDAHPRVRLEAIRALSFFSGERPLAVALELMAQPTDQYLNYTFEETLKTLENRIGSGKIDRKNIAASMLGLLEKAAPERKGTLIETIVRHGSPKELEVIWKLALAGNELPSETRAKSLEWLAEAALTRKAMPPVVPDDVVVLLRNSEGQAQAIRLASAWNVKEAAEPIRVIAEDSATPAAIRHAAIDALAAFGDDKSVRALQSLASPKAPVVVRFRAAVALAQVNLKEGAEAAAKALADAKESDDPSFVVEAFLVRKKGSEALAEAIKSYKLSPDGAKLALRAMYLAGRNDAALDSALSKHAGLDAANKLPTEAEIADLGKEALAKGDAQRGELIFRRAEVGCIKCHSLHKTGGAIGPDLGPIGKDSPIDYVVRSILDPSASIKEEYLTKTIETAAGAVLNGIVVAQNKNAITLKDATGKLTVIPRAAIESMENGKSLMPEGVTRLLTRAELLDLIRFVGDLGKPGTPYAMPTATTVQRWKKLRTLNANLTAGVPNREVVRESLLAPGTDAWESVYSLVNGTVPLDEFRKSGAPTTLVYLQTDVMVNAAGALDLIVAGPPQTTFWIDEDPYDNLGPTTVTLTPGRHRMTVRAIAAAGQTPVRVEVRKPADSKIQYELSTGHGE